MILIDINNLSVNIGEKTIISGITLSIQQGQCVGLTGLNGAGKTTLMKAILGIQEYSGTVSVAKNTKIGYLEQHHNLTSTDSVLQEVSKAFAPLFEAEKQMHSIEEEMANDNADMEILGEKYQRIQDKFENLGGYGWKSRLYGVLKGLGVAEELWDNPVCNLSGGEKTRISLAKMLLENNDVLMLDEPTNHLDIGASQWLTDYLSRYGGTVLLISHDRYMMDKLCDGVAQIENGKLHYFKGNYTDYCRKWEEELKANQRLYDKQQDEIKRQRAIIARYRQFNREKSIKAAESREKVLAKMELVDAPESHEDMRLNFAAERVSGGDVLTFRGVGKSFGEKKLFENFSAQVKQGDKIAIIGQNGAGKTTLMEMLLARQLPDSGTIVRGVNVDFGYYEQGQKEFTGNDTVMDMVWLGDRELTQTQVRSRCAAMLFFGEDVFKTGNVLSGGERARCALCKLSVSKSNTLIMDEPTNHLDMDSREVLEDALERFEGTIIAVSHDRYFINRIANKLWIIKDGKITEFIGSYDDYLLSLRQPEETVEKKEINKTQAAKERAKDRASRDEEKRKQARVRELEKTIEKLEEKISEFENIFSGTEIYANPEKLLLTQQEYEKTKTELDCAMNEWMEASQ